MREHDRTFSDHGGTWRNIVENYRTQRNMVEHDGTEPKIIRNTKTCGVPEFKEILDICLSYIPDQPKVGI